MLSPKHLRSDGALPHHLLVHPQAGFDRAPAPSAALQHSVRHRTISQVLRPDVAAFMADDRVVVWTHHDELCCVERVKFIAESPFGETDIEYLEQFPQLVRLDFDSVAIDSAHLRRVAGKLSQLQHLDLSRCGGVKATGLASVGQLSQLQYLDQRVSRRRCSSAHCGGGATAAALILQDLRRSERSHC